MHIFFAFTQFYNILFCDRDTPLVSGKRFIQQYVKNNKKNLFQIQLLYIRQILGHTIYTKIST